MGKGFIQVGVKNVDSVIKNLDKLRKAPETVIKRTMSDIKSRGPSWVAAGVAQIYGVKAKEISGGKLGTLKIEGDGLKSLKLKYAGRGLTPTHFSMTPKASRESYSLKYEITRGNKTVSKVKKLTKKQRRAIGNNFNREGTRTSDHSPIMLMGTGNGQAGGTNYIPFQRKSPNRKDITSIKTVTLPQMITEGKDGPMHERIAEKFNDGLEKRLEQHLKLLTK